VVALVRAGVACEPLVALPEYQGALQAVALVELQLSVDVPPLGTLVGLAVSVTVGAGTTVTVALAFPVPPAPVQVTV